MRVRSKLQGFGDVPLQHDVISIEIGDRARHLQRAMVSSGGHAKSFGRGC
jgi:hypothetical protein